MRLSRNALDVACAGSGAARSRVALWALVGALGFMALLFMVSSGWRSIGWRAGLFCALAALVPEPRRPGASSLVDVAVAALACVIELVTRSSLATICIGAAASATGWSLGRSALALIKLYGAGRGLFARECEAAAVNWFAALQRTPPERFDWEGLERWMRAHPAHRDAYERVEAAWYAESVTRTPHRPRGAVIDLSRAAAVTKLGLRLAPVYANRVLVFSAAVVLTAVAVYA